MTDQPTTPGLRGAVDLTALGAPTPSSSTAPSAGTGRPGSAQATTSAVPGRRGLFVEATDATFTEVVNASVSVPLIVVLWAAQFPESRDYLDVVLGAARGYGGRVQVVGIDVESNPGLLRAFQVQSVPMTMGLLQQQPVPLFAGAQPAEQLRAVIDELLALAVQHGVTGRVELDDDGEAQGEQEQSEDELPPLHQAAYEAIERGDLDAAAEAYRQALADNPADADAELGLAQVALLQRTQGVDLQAARQAAAEHPTDVAAQSLVADLDVLGGHVEDAFARMVDLVRATSDAEREQAKSHLLGLFAVVGAHDERVRKARTALMSALF